jgi:hypothetical protein
MKKFKQKIQITIASLLLIVPALLYSLPARAAGSATMYLSPASGSQVVGGTLTVNIYEDSGANQINAVDADINYPAGQLNFVNYAAAPKFDLAGPHSAGGGSVKLSLATTQTPGYLTGSQLIATVNFTVTAAGSATISFASSTAVYGYSDGKALTLSTVLGSYNLTAPVQPTPPPSSPPAGPGSTGGSTSSKPSSSTAKPTSPGGTASSASPSPTAPSNAENTASPATAVSNPANATAANRQGIVHKSGFALKDDWPWLAAGIGLLAILAAFIIWPMRTKSYTQPSASSQSSMPAADGMLPPPKPSKFGGLKNPFDSILKPGAHASLVVYLIAFAGIGGYITWRIFAAAPPAPTIYLNPLNPSTPSIGISTIFTVQVRENSGTTAVNAVQANFSYPANLVDFVSIDTTGSAFDIDAPSSGGSGQVSIARGLASTSVTGDKLVATVTFKSKTTGGSIPMAFTTGTALVSYSTNSDILGSLSVTGGVTYTIDTVAPTAAITAPANGASIGLGITTKITATASDTSSSVSKVEILVDGAVKATLTASPYDYSWNTTGLTLGSHTVQARATDSAGNVGTSTVVTVTVADKTAPTTPLNLRATTITSTGINLAWDAASDNIGVTDYRVSRGGTTLGTPTALTYSDSGLTANTAYNYSVVALDAAGNASPAATVTASNITGDINGDGKVNTSDLSRMAASWYTTGNFDAACDLNHDSSVNTSDLSILARNWLP